MLTIFKKRSVLDVWQSSEYVSEWHIETWQIEQMCVIIVLPIIRNQSKPKTISHTGFKTFINNNSRYKTQKVSWWVLGIGDVRNINKSLFIKNVVIYQKVVYSGSFKCYKVFSLRTKKESPKRCDPPKR